MRREGGVGFHPSRLRGPARARLTFVLPQKTSPERTERGREVNRASSKLEHFLAHAEAMCAF